jgi:hypothetical protein
MRQELPRTDNFETISLGTDLRRPMELAGPGSIAKFE